MRIILIIILFISNFLRSENVFSIEHWTRNSVTIYSFGSDQSVVVAFEFINYEFGKFGEHAYLERCDFSYSIDGADYHRFMSCEVQDQVRNDSSFINMTDKLAGVNLELILTFQPFTTIKWVDGANMKVKVKNSLHLGGLLVNFIKAGEIGIKNIRISGKWRVNGLYCSDQIVAEVYPVQYFSSKLEVSNELKQMFLNASDFDFPENNIVKVYKDADAVIVKGAAHTQNILIYTTTGEAVKSVVVNDDVVRIHLPVNQIYIIHVGQTTYKVVL